MKFERIILHIGRHKSGTSSIQNLLRKQASALSNKGFLYPQSGRRKSKVAHHELALALKTEQAQQAIDTFCKELRSEWEPSHHTLILSSEAFQNLEEMDAIRVNSP